LGFNDAVVRFSHRRAARPAARGGSRKRLARGVLEGQPAACDGDGAAAAHPNAYRQFAGLDAVGVGGSVRVGFHGSFGDAVDVARSAALALGVGLGVSAGVGAAGGLSAATAVRATDVDGAAGLMKQSREAGGGAGRLLGIDLGERRIGLAIGDSATRTALPLTTISRGKTVASDAQVVSRIAAEQRVSELVVGLPLHMDGAESPQAERTRDWAEAVSAATGLTLRFRDERLTSERAERRIGGAARGRSGGPPTSAQREAYRARVDREAAALILQDEFDDPGGDDVEHRTR
jgi:putative Holliday junction resolvase